MTDKAYTNDNITILPDENDLAKLDELLCASADTLTAEVDFDAIKQRAVQANKRKQAKRRRLFSCVAAAACMLLCFGVVGSAIMNRIKPGGNITAHETDNPNSNELKDPFEDSIPNRYTQCIDVGLPTKGGESISDIEPTEFYPEELPGYMYKRIENDDDGSVRSVAVGKDTAGNCRYFDCSIISFAPYKLFPGEVGTFEIGKDTVFYWQLDNDSVLCARFFGFDNDDAMKLFKGMIQDMKK